MDLASVVAALASVGVRVSGSTPNSSVQGDSSRACPTGLAGPEPSGTINDPGQHFHPNPNPGGNSEPSGGQSGPTTHSQTQAQQEQGAKREHEGGDDGNAKKRSRFMRMARELRNKGFEVTCPAEF